MNPEKPSFLINVVEFTKRATQKFVNLLSRLAGNVIGNYDKAQGNSGQKEHNQPDQDQQWGK